MLEWLGQHIDKYTNGELASLVEEEFGFYASKDGVRSAMKKAGLKRDEETLEEIRSRAISEALPDQSGENNHNWRGGVSENGYERYRKQYKENNPEKIRAHRKVRRAIQSGELKRKPCEICGEEPADAHHHDYSKPLDVVWLCRKHHMELHGLA